MDSRIHLPNNNIRPWPRTTFPGPRMTPRTYQSENNPGRATVLAPNSNVLPLRLKLPEIFDADWKNRKWQGEAKELELLKEKRRVELSPSSSPDSGIFVSPHVQYDNKLGANPNPSYNHALEPRLCSTGPAPITPKNPYQLLPPPQVSNQGDFNPLTAGPGDVMLNNLAATLTAFAPDNDGQKC